MTSYFEGTSIANVAHCEQNYNQLLNQHPVPALMKQLNEPLAHAHIIPAQEQVMLAFGPFATIRNVFRKWPTEETVTAEKNKLDSVKTQIEALKDLINAQIDFIEGRTQVDQSAAIKQRVDTLKHDLVLTKRSLNSVSHNDARYSHIN